MSKFLVACDDGHGINTAGKRTPLLKEDIKFRGKVYKKFVPLMSLTASTVAQKESYIHENEFNKNIMEMFMEGCKRCNINTLEVAKGDSDVPLATRVSMANAKGADLYISFHANALSGKWQSKAYGLVVIIHEICQEKTKVLAKNVYDYLKDGVNWYKDGGSKYGVRKDTDISGFSLYVLKNTKMPAVLVEYGFMDNWEDVKRMCSEKFARDCAEGTLKGVCKTLGVRYVEDGKVNISNDGVVYRVVAGSYSNRDRAEDLVKELKGKGYDAFVACYSV
ncbi:MAG: N-acetylmuramoyl-L-alanine amidase [Terrisporobacter sp.]